MGNVKFSQKFQVEINTLLDLVDIKALNRLVRSMLVVYIERYRDDMGEEFYDTLLELNFLFGFLDTAEDEQTTNSLEEAAISSEETMIPSEETPVHLKETTIPSKESTISSEETAISSEEIATPSEETMIPLEEITIHSGGKVLSSEEINRIAEDISRRFPAVAVIKYRKK